MTSRMTENLIKVVFFLLMFGVLFLQSLITKAEPIKILVGNPMDQTIKPHQEDAASKEETLLRNLKSES